VLLLASSYIFYAFSRASYVLLIAFSTVVDYVAARAIASTSEDNIYRRRLFLAVSILVNLSVLLVFKYFNFFGTSVNLVLESFGVQYRWPAHHLILPVGISFYTFQSMAYTIDVYRGTVPVERNPGIFATYVAFFPQLVAGPIERAQNMLPQFRQTHQFDYDRIVLGLRRVLWGAFKKIVIADQLAVYVNAVYGNLPQYKGLPLLVGTFFFTIQIYCDFSGYSDIAIGSAQVMGFNLMENFRQPYFSRSVREFWRNWHISLSTWFHQYLYIPLGGNRVRYGRHLLNLMIVFLVSGLWHGANWTFVIWGGLHGLYIVLETIYSKWEQRPRFKDTTMTRWLQRGVTFLVVMFAWIFFRANSMSDALFAVSHLFDFSAGREQLLRPLFNMAFDPRLIFISFFILIAGLFCVEWGNKYLSMESQVMQFPAMRWSFYYAALACIIVALLMVPPGQPFIYFQF
jgi:D-alanyl-lipoteichoic acid acyltransferase DltB (MBOAT superfamily)